MSNARRLFGDEFVDGVTTIRERHEVGNVEDAIHNLLEDLFTAKFDAIERRAADTDSLELHLHAWRIHDSFVAATTLPHMLAAYGRAVRLEGKV